MAGRRTFGSYLKELRTKEESFMSQDKLAQAVGRGKMTISQFENDKNAPPQGELLDNIVNALNVTKEEELELRFLAAQHRQSLPNDIREYFFANPVIYEVISFAAQNNVTREMWERIKQFIEEQ